MLCMKRDDIKCTNRVHLEQTSLLLLLYRQPFILDQVLWSCVGVVILCIKRDKTGTHLFSRFRALVDRQHNNTSLCSLEEPSSSYFFYTTDKD